MSLRRVDRHSGRFVDHEDMFVFIDDREIRRNRNDLFRSFFLCNMDIQAVTRLEDCIGIDDFPI